MSLTLAPPSLPLSKSMLSFKAFMTLDEWKLALGQVKLLYLQRRYKQCIARCEALLEQSQVTVREVHTIYLHFYSAICRESLGLLAHTYSVKKLSFLKEAREAFDAALEAFPKQRSPSTKAVEKLEDPFSDPISPMHTSSEGEDVSTAGTTPVSAFAPSPTGSVCLEAAAKSFPHSDTLADIEDSLRLDSRSLLPQTDTLANIEASLYVEDKHGQPFEIMFRSSSSSIRVDCKSSSEGHSVHQKLALNANVDSPPLFPAPLKFRKKLPSLPGPPPARSLPPLPPVVLSPTPKQRKTGLITSIDSYVTTQRAEKERRWCPLPRIFSEEDDKENVPPPDATPRARNRLSLQSPLSGRSTPRARKALSPINTSLANGPVKQFRLSPGLPQKSSHEIRYASLFGELTSQINGHITHIESVIAETSLLQQERRRKKLLGQDADEGRKASYWLLSSKETTRRVKGDKTKEKDSEFQERIERLRREGWSVNKERKGWKGERYYEDLRERACAEMEESAILVV